MANWERDSDLTHALDYRLVHNTFVTMFRKMSILDDTVHWLAGHGYDVVTLRAGTWNFASDMLRDIGEALDFPDYYGQNLDALNDCLRDVARGDYGWHPEATGLVLVLTDFEMFAEVDRRTAQVLLDIIADRARAARLGDQFGGAMRPRITGGAYGLRGSTLSFCGPSDVRFAAAQSDG